MELALRTGYRLVDCAFVYLNEAEVGETLQTCFKNGVVRREDIFITSKLWYVLNSSTRLLIEGGDLEDRDFLPRPSPAPEVDFPFLEFSKQSYMSVCPLLENQQLLICTEH